MRSCERPFLNHATTPHQVQAFSAKSAISGKNSFWVAACSFSAPLPWLSNPGKPSNFRGLFDHGSLFRRWVHAPAIFGNEQGNLEAWVYPLKVVRNFHLLFHIDGATMPAEALARTLIVHPESTTIVYTGDIFSVRETLFVPVHEPGAIISF